MNSETGPASVPSPALGRGILGPVEAVLFDLDGVLVDSYAAWHRVLNLALAERGLRPIDGPEMRAGWGQGIKADARQYFRGESVESLVATYDRLFLECLESVGPAPGALETVSTLAERGLRLAVVTNSPRVLATRILELTRLAPYFAALAGGDEVPHPKPDPALLELGALRLGVSLTGCVFIGDTGVDVEAGRRASCRTIGLGVNADWRIEALGDLLPLLPLPR